MRVVLMLAFFVFCGVQVFGQDASAAAEQPSRGIVLGPGDSVMITVLDEAELSKQWTISQSGDLFLPYVERIPVAGKTPKELEEHLFERLKQYIRNPMVTVTVAALKSRPVTVNGAVRNPGIYQIEGGATLFQLLALAGGVDGAGTSVVLTRERGAGSIDMPHAKWINGGAQMQIELSIRDVLGADGIGSQVVLKPNDVVTVEKTKSRLIYLAGEVTTPGAIQLDTTDSVYVTQAIAMVGGYKQTANLDKAMLWRCCDAGQKPQIIPISLKKIMEGKAEDRTLTEGDYLVIPSKGASRNWPATIAAMSALISSYGTLSIIARE